MKLSLLEIVQSIMSDMDSDAVTSIADTVESTQVASTVRDVYYQMISNQTIPEIMQLKALEDVGSVAFLGIPDDVFRIEWLKYNKIRDGDTFDSWSDVNWLCPKDFIDLLFQRKSDDSNIVLLNDPNSGVGLLVQNDKAPQWWTSFDDENIMFDSYDAAVDVSGLDATKSLTWLSIDPGFSLVDGFVPDIDDHLFPLLLAESKSTCFINLKQQANPKVEKQAHQQRNWAQNDKYRSRAAQDASTRAMGPNFGRRNAGWSRSSVFKTINNQYG